MTWTRQLVTECTWFCMVSIGNKGTDHLLSKGKVPKKIVKVNQTSICGWFDCFGNSKSAHSRSHFLQCKTWSSSRSTWAWPIYSSWKSEITRLPKPNKWMNRKTENEEKWKQNKNYYFNFTRNYNFSTSLKIKNVDLETVSETKLLGTILTNDLKWERNTAAIEKKADARMELLIKVKSFNPLLN